MGKLLQKLVNGIVPSWLSKIKKSSATASPKKLLPSSKGAIPHVSSLPSSSSSSSSSSIRTNTEVLPLVVACDNTNQSIIDEEGRTASMKPKTHKNNENQQHHHQDHNDPHHPHHLDVKTYNNQGMPEHSTNSRVPPSSRKHGTPSIQEDQHDHHPQQHCGNCNSGLGLEKRNKCLPEADNHHPQEARSGCDNADHVERCDKDCLELDREVNVCVQEESNHNCHDKELNHEAEIGLEHYKNGRKTQDLQEEEEEGGEEEEVEGGSRGSSSMDTTGWGWKRRKGERGVMSCELPESICRIVGNGKAVVKHSQDPHMAMWESMVEMIVGNGIWEMGNLQFLLFCYLSLNEPHLHPIIQSCFLQVLKDLEETEF